MEHGPACLLEMKSKPAEETIRLLGEGRSFEEIANLRGRQLASVVGLVATLVEKGELQFQTAGWMGRSGPVSKRPAPVWGRSG